MSAATHTGLKIVADAGIADVQHWFADLGEVCLVDGRSLTRDDLQTADALLVRSVTQVNKDLLQNTPVRFVGSATAGIEHIDQAYLQTQNIAFAHAPGSNAQAVVEYVLSALMLLNEPVDLSQQCIAVIGCGQVGSRLLNCLSGLGLHCLAYDPPLQAAGQSVAVPFAGLQDVQNADILSLHIPLTDAGPYTTRHWIDAAFLQRLKPHTLLINTARSGVVDSVALLHQLRQQKLRAALDVWNNEPLIDLQLVQQTCLATPHIAGYSVEAKQNASRQLLQALADFFQLPMPTRSMAMPTRLPPQTISTTGLDAVRDMVFAAYDIGHIDAQLRQMQYQSPDNRSAWFDNLRKTQTARREFCAYRWQFASELTVSEQVKQQTAQQLRLAGFTQALETV